MAETVKITMPNGQEREIPRARAEQIDKLSPKFN